MFTGTAREKYFYHNTLTCLVKALIDQSITVDLRNDSYICGLLMLVDGFMNLSFSKAVYCDPQGNEYSFEQLFVQARNIRYIHVPEEKSVLATIKDELKRKPREPVEKPVQKTRKAKKALQQHMKTVAELGNDQKD